MVEQTVYNGMNNVQTAPYQSAQRIEHHYSAERIAKLREGRMARREEQAKLEREVRFIDSICM